VEELKLAPRGQVRQELLVESWQVRQLLSQAAHVLPFKKVPVGQVATQAELKLMRVVAHVRQLVGVEPLHVRQELSQFWQVRVAGLAKVPVGQDEPQKEVLDKKLPALQEKHCWEVEPKQEAQDELQDKHAVLV
jgi:hypothetical protein